MERTPGRATLTSLVVGPLHSYTQEGWVDNNNMGDRSTKRIQPARGWCATVPQSGGLFGGTLCKLYPPTPPLRRPGRPVFWGSQPCVPATWLAERLLLAGDIESNPGHAGPLVVYRESGAPADQVEETPGRASLEKLGCRTPPQLHAGGVCRQQHGGQDTVESRSSVFSIYYAHCSVPHRTPYWTACSGLLYIVSCLELCCRVSVLGF